jgi:hypothetical protein
MITTMTPRVKDWFLMQSVVPTIVVTILYIFVVLAGMKFMEKREPLKLGNLLFQYNVALVVLNLHIFTQVRILDWCFVGH